MLTYARIEAISQRLAGRVTIINQSNIGILGVTGTQIGTDLIYLIGEGVEEMMNMYLGMIYYMPLINKHPFLSSIAEKLICSEVYLSLFPTQGEAGEATDAYAATLRLQALNDFQTLFDGLGIFVPGSTNASNALQNDESRSQQIVKAVILVGEKIKKYIGYDVDDDGVVDTDMFKKNTNIEPSFYMAGDMERRVDGDLEVLRGVRLRPKYREELISFW